MLFRSRSSSSPPATYARGSKRLDYVLASKSVCDALLASGYDAFNSRIASDHRGYYMDFKTDILFGSNTQQLATKTNWILSSVNHTQVTAYIRRKYEILESCNAFDRARRLLEPGTRNTYSERLDKDVTAASLAAEKSLPRYGDPAWSVELVEARLRVTILTKLLSHLNTQHSTDCVAMLQEWQTTLQMETLPVTRAECSKLLREAKANVKAIAADSLLRRDEELARKLITLEQSESTVDRESAKHLRRLRKAEDIKQLFKKLKYVRTKSERRGVTRLEIPRDPTVDPKQCQDWKQVDVPTDILDLLQTRNRLHFGQAHGTPFTIPPLSTALGFDGDSIHGRSILHGTYECESLDEHVQLLLRYLQQIHRLTESTMHAEITEDEFRDKLKVWSEATTTSPSGLHLGHYKSLIARHSFMSGADDDDLTPEYKAQRDELNLKQNTLFRLHLDMLNYALRSGYS